MVFPREMGDLLEVEVIVEVLVYGLQLLQHTTLAVVAEVLKRHTATFMNRREWISKFIIMILVLVTNQMCVETCCENSDPLIWNELRRELTLDSQIFCTVAMHTCKPIIHTPHWCSLQSICQ